MGSFFYNLLILPIEYILDFLFSVISRLFDSYGLAIIFVSIAVQILTIPLYNKAEHIQQKERQKQKDMENWISHIKNSFKGKERFMMVSAYYKEQHYKPIYALRGSISLLLQVPFFIAAYNFLSHLEILEGKSFFILSNLGKPDACFTINGFALNIMPVLMTAINICSCSIYAKNYTKKEKVQLYAIAVLFLVLLYSSPSGLVLYWTMNNLFSLCKNIVNAYIKNKKRFINILFSLLGTAVFIKSFSFASKKKLILSLIIVILCFVPHISSFFSKYASKYAKRGQLKNKKLFSNTVSSVSGFLSFSAFILPAVFLALLIGTVIPVTVTSSSPLEFVRQNYGPVNFVLKTTTISFGFFVVWLSVYFFLCSEKTKKALTIILYLLAIVFTVNFFFFGKELGVLSNTFEFERINYSLKSKLLNLFVNFFLVLCFIVFNYKFRNKFIKFLKYTYSILIISAVVFCLINTVKNSLAVRQYRNRLQTQENALDNNLLENSGNYYLKLDKNGKNIILFMLDRAISSYFPFIVEENETVAGAFSDFVYYPNTLSFGGHTNFGSPSIFGGYEYTPQEINKRDSEKLVDKHNEALLVLPVIFSENNFDVIVTDPPYAGYSWISDLTIYEPYPDIKTHNLIGRFTNSVFWNLLDEEHRQKNQAKSAFFYSLMRCIPTGLQNYLYDNGNYWSSMFLLNAEYGTTFMDSASELMSLCKITEISDSGKNNFLCIQNDTAHEPNRFLKYPDYSVSNSQTSEIQDFLLRYLPSGEVMSIQSDFQKGQYYSTAFSFIQLANWINFMKENNVYDNTRIVIISDHGYEMSQFNYMMFDNNLDIQRYNPVFLVKDFTTKPENKVNNSNDNGSFGYKTDNSFMTTADAPIFILKDVIENPQNPFTHKSINSSEKDSHAQLVTTSHNWHTDNSRYTFDTSDGVWYEVKDNIFEKQNWQLRTDI